MLVKTKKKTFVVKWRYANGDGKTDKRGRHTQCQIFEGTGDKKVLISDATAYCNPIDVFNKHMGRKLSLYRALLGMDESGFGKGTPFTKEERTDFWSEYFRMVGGIY